MKEFRPTEAVVEEMRRWLVDEFRFFMGPGATPMIQAKALEWFEDAIREDERWLGAPLFVKPPRPIFEEVSQ